MTDRKPNILLLVGEDTGRHLGCYGDPDACTPNLDRLAADGLRATRAFTHCPVCAPSRSGLVTGRLPYAIGSHHMRSTLRRPPPLFTRVLKDAGWHVRWPGKTDFNFELDPHEVTDTRDWQAEGFPAGPWFCYANINNTHESCMWPPDAWEDWHRPYHLERESMPGSRRCDPARLSLPPFLPDTAAVRADLARHHDNVRCLDDHVGRILAQLEAAGQADSTIVIFLADHGAGIPRGKRWCYDLGLHMPLLVRWPGRIAPGTVHEGLVAWVDIGAQILAWCGLAQQPGCHGAPVLSGASRPFCFGGRDRMDEQFDRVRSARSGRCLYIRNYRPDLPWAQRNHYLERMPSMRDWRRLHAAGRLDALQSAWFAPRKPAEEFYDCELDPWQVRNLAGDPSVADELARHRTALDDHLAAVGDLGATPESELIAAGVVVDRMAEYRSRIAPLPPPCDNLGGPWDVDGGPLERQR